MNDFNSENEPQKSVENNGIDKKDEVWVPEQLLAEVGFGRKVSVFRSYPKWADCGWLKTFEVGEDEPLGLETIDNEFGGGRYKARVLDEKGRYRRCINFEIGGHPRNRNGRLAKDPDAVPTDPFGQMEKLAAISKMMQPTETASKTPQPDMSDLLKMFMVMASNNQLQQQPQPQPQLQEKNEGNFDFSGLSKTIQDIQDISNLINPSRASQESDSESSFGMISQLMGFLDQKEKKQEKQSKPASIPLEQMAEAFRKLDSEERAALVGAALSEMDEEEKEIAFQFADENDTPSEHTNEPEENNENTTE